MSERMNDDARSLLIERIESVDADGFDEVFEREVEDEERKKRVRGRE